MLTIGIAGGTASGKTTFAGQLAEAFAPETVEIMHMDKYFKKEKPQMRAPFKDKYYEDFNHPNSFELERFRADLYQAIAAARPQILIVEGLLILYDDSIRKLLDLKLFIDVPADERIVRRLKRNIARGWDFDDIADFYLDCVRYRHDQFVEPSRWHADLVINGSQISPLSLEVIVSWCHTRLATD